MMPFVVMAAIQIVAVALIAITELMTPLMALVVTVTIAGK